MQIETAIVTEGLQSLYDRLPDDGKEYIQNAIEHYIKEFKKVLDKEGRASMTYSFMSLLDETMQKNVEWKHIKCKKGCSFCCHINVEMTLAEAEVIVWYCRQKNIEIDVELLKIQEHLNNRERARHPQSGCAFLTENGACKIYPVRPLVCRKYIVGTDPQLCDATKEAKNVGIYVELQTEIQFSAFANLEMERGNMSTLILKAIEDAG